VNDWQELAGRVADALRAQGGDEILKAARGL